MGFGGRGGTIGQIGTSAKRKEVGSTLKFYCPFCRIELETAPYLTDAKGAKYTEIVVHIAMGKCAGVIVKPK